MNHIDNPVVLMNLAFSTMFGLIAIVGILEASYDLSRLFRPRYHSLHLRASDNIWLYLKELFYSAIEKTNSVQRNVKRLVFGTETKILVIEDDPTLVPIIRMALKSFFNGYQIDWTTTSKDAKNISATERYDMIIADYYLQGIETGMDFWKDYHEKHPRTPFMLTSSMPKLKYEQLYHRYSDRPVFLQKPFTMNQCKEAFHKIAPHSHLNA